MPGVEPFRLVDLNLEKLALSFAETIFEQQLQEPILQNSGLFRDTGEVVDIIEDARQDEDNAGVRRLDMPVPLLDDNLDEQMNCFEYGNPTLVLSVVVSHRGFVQLFKKLLLLLFPFFCGLHSKPPNHTYTTRLRQSITLKIVRDRAKRKDRIVFGHSQGCLFLRLCEFQNAGAYAHRMFLLSSPCPIYRFCLLSLIQFRQR